MNVTITLDQVSSGFRPRPSLSVDSKGDGGDAANRVVGVSTPTFVERARYGRRVGDIVPMSRPVPGGTDRRSG